MEIQNGYIGLTDPDWYQFLSAHPRVDEVNFWQPHGGRTFKAINQGEPFFFKLRAPQKTIAGFGFFERFDSMPAWLAWECFGEMNGAPDFESMIDRIAKLRREPRSLTGDFLIGCVMIASPVFFSEDELVMPPSNWARGIQRGKRYPLGDGEGKRIYLECLERASRAGHYWNVDQVAESGPRYGTPHLVKPRYGQGLFKINVHDAYRNACTVTGEHSMPVLEAAHIVPYALGGEHRVDNGLLLRSDLHRLYDRGYVTITPDYEFRVSDSLREDYHNGRSYYSFQGSRIRLPQNESLHPSRERLDWHVSEIYRG